MRPAATALALAISLALACGSSKDAPPLPSIPCDSRPLPPTPGVTAADVGVYVEGSDALLDPVRADLARYLSAMWGGAVAVASTPPDGSKRVSIWISSSDAARAKAGHAIDAGYAIVRASDGTLVVHAPDAADLAFGAYALLEELGARFFHPKQELVPTLGAPALPATLDVVRKPMARVRGSQPHLLHPIEYLATFFEPSDQNLADAKLFIDWLVKNGENYVQWPLLATVDFDQWKPHARAIMDYAHARGVRIGASPQVWGGSALQDNYVLVSHADKWQEEMTAKLDRLLELPFDAFDLALGEYSSTDAQSVIDWLNFAVAHVADVAPNVEVSVQNHVGNYPGLYVQYQGQTVFYYQLGQYCDPRLAQHVHTIAFFDLYRNWGTYGHPDFHFQHDYLLRELATRKVGYWPESAYWISADVDVPLFLPEFVQARWNDIHGLAADIAAQGLPPLDAHIEFMSGHEWSYWMTDYLVAKMLWEPEQPLDYFFGKYAAAYGSCAGDVAQALSSYTDLQSKFLFDQRLAAYVQGENAQIDFAYLAGLEPHPRRVQFEALLTMSDDDRAAFESNVVAALESFAAQSQPIEDGIAARCRGSDATLAPWCNELWDGIAIVRLRAEHAAALYRGTLALARGDANAARAKVDDARKITAEAAKVVARREAAYRFDLDRLTGVYANPTVFGFGYLRPAHTLCYYARREEQVAFLIENGVPESLSGLPSCAP